MMNVTSLFQEIELKLHRLIDRQRSLQKNGRSTRRDSGTKQNPCEQKDEINKLKKQYEFLNYLKL